MATTDGQPGGGASALQAAIDAATSEAGASQSRAGDPAASAWVSANAGTGKTTVLTRRVIRLLLAGTAPDRILCLTYTKAAAAEMSSRVFAELGKWVTMPSNELRAELSDLIGRQPEPEEIALSRTLFATAIETPGGLKLQTIHAFCERLLQRFPIEAGLAPNFVILDDETRRDMVRTAIDETLNAATRDPSSLLGQALGDVIASTAGERFDNLLNVLISKRADLDALLHDVQQDGSSNDPLAGLDRRLREGLGVRRNVTPETLVAQMASVLPDAELQHAAQVLEGGKKTDNERAACLADAAILQAPAARAEALFSAFLTKKGEPRASLMTKALKEAHPNVAAMLEQAQDTYHRLYLEEWALRIARATAGILRLADTVIDRYTRAKARRAALDFDDLILTTVRLLNQTASAQWVLYKLDSGIDHILVDEAQDTSPEQWQIIENITAEFFAGRGTHESRRTLFAVGDEKQSIYSFQGARPELFAQKGAWFSRHVEAVDETFHQLPLHHSFRTVAPVLEAVDRVFADPARVPGLGLSDEGTRHGVIRMGEPGRVEVWPTEKVHEQAAAEAWAPLDDTGHDPPIRRLTERIARTIRGWLDDREMLAAQKRPISPGDILILVRKRAPFAAPMIRALKAHGIPVAGADRIRITEQIGVRDLMALGDFLLLPEDDLSLAATLKSPLFDLNDDALLAIAHGRRRSLWSALLADAHQDGRLADAAETLRRWRGRADYAPPFEFFSLLLDKGGRRQHMIERLGPEAADAIDEFLSLAIRYEETAPPSLQGFLDWLRLGNPQIRRDMDQGRDEVRVMTVHGAKGLEAPIVFLPDTCSFRKAGGAPTILGLPPADGAPEGAAPTLVWQTTGAAKHPRLAPAKTAVEHESLEEYNRLLYVAMTRARDRLYIAGFEGKSGRDRNCWYDLVADGIAEIAQPVTLADGTQVQRIETEGAPAVTPGEPSDRADEPLPALPDWLDRPAPGETVRPIPVAPSRLVPLDSDEAAEAAGKADRVDAPGPSEMATGGRFTRGLLTHALLQYLPATNQDRWQEMADSFVAARGEGLTRAVRDEIVSETLAILTAPGFARLFGPGTRAEVPLTAEIPAPAPGGRPIRISGTIDRLCVSADTVTIVDFKTNRPPPERMEDVAPAYLMQLAAYRLALKPLFPAHTVKAALLWTDGPRIMEIPTERLDACEPELWKPDARLDARPAPT